MSEPAVAALIVGSPASARQQKRRAAIQIEPVAAGVSVRVPADVDEAQMTQVIRAVRAAGV